MNSRLGPDDPVAVLTAWNAIVDSFDVIGAAMQGSCSIRYISS